MTDHHDVYVQLAKKLDRMPQGFPAAADHVEIELLRWAFTAEEAALAVTFPPQPASAEALALLFNRPLVELDTMLVRMCKRGLLGSFRRGGISMYSFISWLPGLQESQLLRQDRTPTERLEYVHLWERYFPTYAKTASYGPPLARVLPVGVDIKSEARPHRLEDVHRMVDEAKSFWLMPCVCRQERALIGHTCNHLSEVCLVASAEDENFEKSPENGRVISKEEAHRVLDRAEEDGLVHQTWNADNPIMFFICNCCPCCCVLLRPMTEFGQSHAAASNFVALIDTNECVQCGDCLDDYCAVSAISEDGSEYSVDQARCIGCGICTVKCPVDAIKLLRKPDQCEPPTVQDWVTQRLANRPVTL